MSHNPHYKLPLLETVTGENRSFNDFCTMHEDSASNNLVLFFKNVDEIDETELMEMYEHLNCNANYK